MDGEEDGRDFIQEEEMIVECVRSDKWAGEINTKIQRTGYNSQEKKVNSEETTWRLDTND